MQFGKPMAWPKRRDGSCGSPYLRCIAGVIGRGQQQLVAVGLPVGAEIHQHALGDFLIVRIVAHLARGQRDPLHQRHVGTLSQ